jgi:hypothetical protein
MGVTMGMTALRRMLGSRGLIAAAAALVICTACGSVEPSPAPTGERPAGTLAPSSPPAATPIGLPSPTGSPAPSTRAEAEPGPPYRIIGTTEQLPGTILFGWIEDGALDPFAGWPDAGLPIEATFAFGAYWGEPVGTPRIRITLYRIENGVLDLV